MAIDVGILHKTVRVSANAAGLALGIRSTL